jgi:hypothetical protein
MRVRLAIGLGLLLVLGALVIVLSKSEQRLAGTNALVRVSGNDMPIPGRKSVCQPESVPADTTSMRVFVGTRGKRAGPLDVSIKQGGRVVSLGSFGRVRDGLPATAKLSPVISEEHVPARVCFHNRGRAAVHLAGDRTPVPGSGANPYKVTFADEARIDYVRPGRESGWALAGTVADRFGRAKTSFFGSWTMWAVFALLGVTWAAATLLLLRRLPAR